MPAGDAQRVWFPEMLEILRARWSPSTTWTELVALCDRVTTLRTELRRARGIQAPLMTCPCCGKASRSDIAGVSVRSALFALRKAGALSEDDFERLDHAWTEYRAAHGLDRFGKKKATSSAKSTSAGCC